MTDAPSRRPRIAICCQGGGSQTAFTAGALAGLFEAGMHRDFDITAISGTSGGAICATLAWLALHEGDAQPAARIAAFWEENTAQNWAETMFNDMVVETLRFASRGHLPVFATSPSMPAMQFMTRMATLGLRAEFTDLAALLARHIDYPSLATHGATPVLLTGAIDILTGRLRVFSSMTKPVEIEQTLASCAVPNIFPAVPYEGTYYWDGLFSDNPPVSEVIKPAFVGRTNIPDEIWVIKINPTHIDHVPTSPEQIGDRRNELVGNISLFHQLNGIDSLNSMFVRGALNTEYLAEMGITRPIRLPRGFSDEPVQPWHIPFLTISDALRPKLDYESKLDRNPRNITMLVDDGRAQAAAFLAARAAIAYA
jgi:NTE family protein